MLNSLSKMDKLNQHHDINQRKSRVPIAAMAGAAALMVTVYHVLRLVRSIMFHKYCTNISV